MGVFFINFCFFFWGGGGLYLCVFYLQLNCIGIQVDRKRFGYAITFIYVCIRIYIYCNDYFYNHNKPVLNKNKTKHN